MIREFRTQLKVKVLACCALYSHSEIVGSKPLFFSLFNAGFLTLFVFGKFYHMVQYNLLYVNNKYFNGYELRPFLKQELEVYTQFIL